MQQENKKIAKNTFVEMFCQNISTKSKGFTLVELIIVITILGILSTIAYISFQGYTKDARDGIRMSDIKQIYNGLSIYKTQTEKTLLPDNYVSILSGTTTISYQGYAGASVLRTLKISGGKDPGTKDYYIYTTDVNTKKAQLMTYMETTDKDVQLLGRLKNLNIINQAEAVTNSGYYQDKKIYVYGDKIGILTNNKIPLQETTTNTGIDITTLTGSITTYFGGNVYSGGISSSTGLTLVNQINGAIAGKLPCNSEVYNGYNITSLQDSQTGTFTKSTLPSNGTQTGTLNISCSNGLLNYSTKVETFSSLVCNSGYVLSSGNCIKISNVSSFATNLSAYWPMDNSWNDSVSTKHGTPNGSPTFTTGLINQAGNFTGSSYLNMGNVLDVGGGDFTMSFRINPTNTQQTIFEKIQQSGSPWPGYRLSLSSGTTHYAYFNMNTSSGPNTCDTGLGTIAIPSGSWSQVVVSRIGGTISLYVNGVFDKSNSCSGNGSNSNNFSIGLQNGSVLLNAQIDDAAVWIGRGLTSTEVANLY